MRLSPAQQERYARHLILDEFGGEGQERLLAASVHVRGDGVAAHWAARYLAASGLGHLTIDVDAWRDELQGLGPWLALDVRDVQLVHTPVDGAFPAESAMNGAMAALEIVRKIVRGERE